MSELGAHRARGRRASVRARGFGAALVLLGAVTLIVALEAPSCARIRRQGPDVWVNPGVRAGGNIDANNSPSLAQDPVDPAVLALANRIDTPVYSCALSVSRNGGRSWSAARIPLPAGDRKCYAPDVAFGPRGTLYIVFVTLHGFGNGPDGVWLVRSNSGGRTLSAPRRVLGAPAFQVRLATDPARPRRLYLTWVQATATNLDGYSTLENPIEAMRSDDGGLHWSRALRVSSARRERVVSPVPEVGPGGVVYVLYLDLGGDALDYEGAGGGFGGPPYARRFSLVLARSLDAGSTWQESVVSDSIVPTRRFIAFLAPYPTLAMDRRSGRIYVAFEDARLGDPDVYLWTLPPAAREWSAPVRVNDTPPHDGTWQYLPALSVAPDGRLDVVYYDRRSDRSDRLSTVSLQSSFDNGRTFTGPLTLTTHSFDSQIGYGSGRGLADLGNRSALLSDNSSALAAWADTRFGTVLSGKQDIAFARVSFATAAGLSAPFGVLLLAAGAALALLGVALQAYAWRLRAVGASRRSA
ncbi:MAG: hypothetical protein ACR2JH_02435 [Solirubrobacteraceae bacterium]